MPRSPEWSTQQLAEFVAAVSSFETEGAAALGAVERAAEALDAEVAAIVADREIMACVGYPCGSAPIVDLQAVASGVTPHLLLPGVGECPAIAVSLDEPPGARFILARSGCEGLTREEVCLVHGMARVTSMRLRTLRLLAEERSLRADLAASRLRVVAAADEMRRRIERNLHDGTQQRLITLSLRLRGLHDQVPGELEAVHSEVSRIEDGVASLLEELREISRGLHPPLLSAAGLGAALRSLVRRAALPVGLDVQLNERLPEPAEAAAYYVVSEALANAAKHAAASAAEVRVLVSDGALHVDIRDDGAGGADPARGSGLIGLRDRVEALGGRMTLASPPGQGTSIAVEIPLGECPELLEAPGQAP